MAASLPLSQADQDRFKADYVEFGAVRELLAKNNGDICKLNLYTLGMEKLIAEARKEHIAIMPLGAGGPGTNCAAFSRDGVAKMKGFFEKQDAVGGKPGQKINELTDNDEASLGAIIKGQTGGGTIAGYTNVSVGKSGIQYQGWENAGFELPRKAVPARYDQWNRRFVHMTDLPVKTDLKGPQRGIRPRADSDGDRRGRTGILMPLLILQESQYWASLSLRNQQSEVCNSYRARVDWW